MIHQETGLGGWTEDQRYALRDLGHTLLSEGRADLARNIFAGLVESDPSDSYSRFGLGVCLRRLQSEDAAVRELQEALRIDRALWGAAYHLAEVYLSRGEEEKGSRYASMVETLGRGRPEAARAARRLRRLSRVAAKGPAAAGS